MNQKPACVEEIAKEMRRTYQLLRIFELHRSGSAGKLRARISLRGLHSSGVFDPAGVVEILLDGAPIPDLWSSERDPVTFSRDKDLTDRMVLAASKMFVQAAIEPYKANVYPVFGIRERLHLRCPDLIAAMYLQFAALVDGKRPTAICQGCGNLFLKRRRDQQVCNTTCRSRKHRKSDAV